jgi:hypothetical protein
MSSQYVLENTGIPGVRYRILYDHWTGLNAEVQIKHVFCLGDEILNNACIKSALGRWWLIGMTRTLLIYHGETLEANRLLQESKPRLVPPKYISCEDVK